MEFKPTSKEKLCRLTREKNVILSKQKWKFLQNRPPVRWRRTSIRKISLSAVGRLHSTREHFRGFNVKSLRATTGKPVAVTHKPDRTELGYYEMAFDTRESEMDL